jgi:hypothetical protein
MMGKQMNLWVIHQTTDGIKKWKLEPRKNPWVLGTSRESALRINTASATTELYGAFDFKNNQWSFTRLTPPDADTNVQRSISINEATEITFAGLSVRVVPLKDRAEILGTKNSNATPDKASLSKIVKELASFKMRHFFDRETSPFFNTAIVACLILLVFVALAPKITSKGDKNDTGTTKTVEVKTDFLVKSKAIAKAMKNSVAPKQQQRAPSASGTTTNSKQLIGAIFNKIQGRSLQKVLKNVTLTAASKNVVAGVLSKSLSQFSKNIPDGRQLAAVGSRQASGMGAIGVNTVGSNSGNVAGLGKMDHGDVGNARIGLMPEESDVKGGLAREVISSYIQSKLGPILYCYERQLSATPELFGKVAVKFSIKADGFVDHSEISETTLRSQSVEACLLSQVNQWKFPKPEGGMKVVVTYPFMFKSVN